MSRPIKITVLGVGLLLLVTTFLAFTGGPDTKTATAHFERAVSVYVGTEVRILGVTVGEVTDVVPEGDSVRVEMEYEADYQVPADAQAAIITPTLVADRFIQLSPVYTGGEEMADGADIPLEQTGSPVELDRIYASLSDLANALGPNGANANGSLDDLLTAGSKTLKGRGETANQMLFDLSRAAETFGNNSGDLFATVRQLDAFTQTLADNDRVVDQFISDLGRASAQLAGEREEIEALLAALAGAIDTVRTFVRDNRQAVVGRVEELTAVVDELAKEKDGLALVLEKGPVGASNLAVAFDKASGSIGSRVNVDGNIEDLDGFLCALVTNGGVPQAEQVCTLLETILEPLNLGLPSRGGQGPAPDSRILGEVEPAEGLPELLGGAS